MKSYFDGVLKHGRVQKYTYEDACGVMVTHEHGATLLTGGPG